MLHIPLQASATLQEVLRKISTPSHFTKSSLLFSQGEQARGVFLVEAGPVGLLLKLAPKRRTVLQRRAEKGSVLGLPATLNNVAYSLTAKAMDEVEVAFVTRERLIEVINDNTSLAMEIVNLLSVEVLDLRNVIRKRSGRQVNRRSETSQRSKSE
jgi:CRP-like cAMP-binding protein